MCPDGYTCHFCPSTSSERAGILEVDLLIHARRIESLVRRIRVSDGQCLLVVRLRELDESSGKRRLLENPEPAVCRAIMGSKGLESLGIVCALGRRNCRALNGESLGHFRVQSPEMSRWFSLQKPGTGPRWHRR